MLSQKKNCRVINMAFMHMESRNMAKGRVVSVMTNAHSDNHCKKDSIYFWYAF